MIFNVRKLAKSLWQRFLPEPIPTRSKVCRLSTKIRRIWWCDSRKDEAIEKIWGSSPCRQSPTTWSRNPQSYKKTLRKCSSNLQNCSWCWMLLTLKDKTTTHVEWDDKLFSVLIYANLAIRVTCLTCLVVTRCVSQVLGAWVAFI